MGEHVAGKIGGDHDLGAKGPRRRHRHRIDQRAVDQPAVPDQDRRENAGQSVGGAHRIDHAAVGQPDFVPGANFGRNGSEFDRQVLDQGLADRGLELGREFRAADQARAVEADIEIAEHAARLQAARPLFQRIEMPGRIGADDDIGHNAMGDQRFDDPDMGKAACGATAERQADHRPPRRAEPDLVGAVGSVLAAAHHSIQHSTSPAGPTLCPISAYAWFMPFTGPRRRI